MAAYENAHPSAQRWKPPGFITIGQMSGIGLSCTCKTTNKGLAL
jgi:hypothetical protein